jgi:hypothetical protein
MPGLIKTVLARLSYLAARSLAHLAPWLHRRLQKLYRERQAARQAKVMFRMVTTEEWCANPVAQSVTLLPEEVITLPPLQGYDLEHGKTIALTRAETTMPAIKLFKVRQAIIKGHSDIIFTGSAAIVPHVYLEPDNISFEEHRNFYRVEGRTLHDLKKAAPPAATYNRAISLVGATSFNWAHFLTEILPKIYLYREHFGNRRVHVIIDRDLPETINQCLVETMPERWRVVQIGIDQTIRIKTGFFISSLGCAPFEYRDPTMVKYEDSVFCENALRLVREKLIPPAEKRAKAPEFLYVRRPKGSIRPMAASDELDALMRRFGFTIIEPATHSFREQVELFSNARVVIGQGGAGLMNTLFSPAGCKIVNLCYYDKILNYYYYGAIAAALNQEIVFMFGEVQLAEEGLSPLLSGLRINPAKLEEYMIANNLGVARSPSFAA